MAHPKRKQSKTRRDKEELSTKNLLNNLQHAQLL